MALKQRLTSPDSSFHASVRFKQRAAIEKIKKDNDALKEELLLANKLSVRPTRHSSVLRIAQLQDEADTLTRKIELEKRKIGMLDIKMDELCGKITTLRRTMGGLTASRDADRVLEKQIKVLENRLEKGYRKYSEGLTKNRQLRETIDDLRRERMMLESINTGLEKEREKLQKEMTTILQNTNAMHQTRDTAFEEMSKLKSKSEKKQASFEKEWAELTNLINEDRQAQETKRIEEMEERERKTQELLKSTQDNDEIRKTLRKSRWSSDKRSQSKSNSIEELQKYECAFEQIRQATGIQEMETVVERIAEVEDENYTLFNYAQELDKDIEVLYRKIAETKTQIEEKENTSVANAPTLVACDTDAQQILKENSLDKNDGVSGLQEAIASGVQMLHKSLKSEPVDSEELSEENLVQYVSEVEALVDNFLKDQRVCDKAVEVRYCIAPPSTTLQDEECTSSAEAFDEERPWFRDDLKSLIESSITNTDSVPANRQ